MLDFFLLLKEFIESHDISSKIHFLTVAKVVLQFQCPTSKSNLGWTQHSYPNVVVNKGYWIQIRFFSESFAVWCFSRSIIILQIMSLSADYVIRWLTSLQSIHVHCTHSGINIGVRLLIFETFLRKQKNKNDRNA